MSKGSDIKARCSDEEKQQIKEYTTSHNINVSEFLLSAAQTVLQCDTPENRNEQVHFFYQYQYNLCCNKLFNLVSLDSTIPANTKERIRKELLNNDFSQFNIL